MITITISPSSFSSVFLSSLLVECYFEAALGWAWVPLVASEELSGFHTTLLSFTDTAYMELAQKWNPTPPPKKKKRILQNLFNTSDTRAFWLSYYTPVLHWHCMHGACTKNENLTPPPPPKKKKRKSTNITYTSDTRAFWRSYYTSVTRWHRMHGACTKNEILTPHPTPPPKKNPSTSPRHLTQELSCVHTTFLSPTDTACMELAQKMKS